MKVLHLEELVGSHGAVAAMVVCVHGGVGEMREGLHDRLVSS